MSNIYTKTGDKGETSLFTGQRVPKDNPLINALGIIDECNCALGLGLAFFPKEPSLDNLKKQLILIQHALFDVGAAIATPLTQATKHKINQTRFDGCATEQLEQWIDEMNEQLPPLHSFILPGGQPTSAMLHQARSICRSAERLVVPLNLYADVSDRVLIYLNRLSDYLFVAARWINHATKTEETIWQHHAHETMGNES